ncbi:alpha/beta hydrolase fold protein [Xylariaceae sp. FL0662B]|nr:alpha/beta hydrolase fold protein [Xylariaceae sp. FL0662B]
MGSTNNKIPLMNPIHPSVANKLDPVFADIYTRFQAPKLRADQVSYEEYSRDKAEYTFPTQKVTEPSPYVASKAIHKIPGGKVDGDIYLQVYVPKPVSIDRGGLRREGLLPAVVNYHGGGFVLGGLESDESLCAKICDRVGCIVVNVAYRLAPQFPHPTPALDGWLAFKWTYQNATNLGIDRTRLAVSGLSAGGCIAAVVAILARDDPLFPPLSMQLLIVPVVDARYVPMKHSIDPQKTPYKSYIDFKFAPMLPLERLIWFYDLWLGKGVDREEKANGFLASPITAQSHANLAPAVILCAEIDPLVSEGTAYHKKLEQAGTPTKLKIYKGQGHAFPHWDGQNPASKELVKDCVRELHEAFAKNTGK